MHLKYTGGYECTTAVQLEMNEFPWFVLHQPRYLGCAGKQNMQVSRGTCHLCAAAPELRRAQVRPGWGTLLCLLHELVLPSSAEELQGDEIGF